MQERNFKWRLLLSRGAHISVPGNASSHVKYLFCILSTAEEIAIWKKMDKTANTHQQMIGVALMKCLRWKTLASVPECHREVRSIEESLPVFA